MIITCEQCLARFRLADDKIKPGGTRVRCSKCQNVFTVMPPLAAAPEEIAAAAGESDSLTAQQAVAAPPREPAAAPVESHGPVEFDFGFTEPGTAPPAVSDDAPVPSPLPSADSAPLPTGATDSADQFLFTAIPPDDLPDTPPDNRAETTAASAAIAGFTDLAAADDDRPATGLAEGTDEDEDRFVFSEAAESAEPVESFSFDQTVAAAMTDGSAATGEFTVVAGDDDRAAVDFAGGTDEDEDQFVFAEEPETSEPTEAARLDQVESEEPSPFDIAAVFGEEDELAWGQATETETFSFDFDEPNFAAASDEHALSRGGEGGLGFGEINFGDQPPEIASEPAPAQVAPPLAASPATPPAAPPPPRPSVRPPQAEELMPPTPAPPRKNPLTRLLLLLALLLLLLCGAGGYFYFAAEGQQFAEQLMLKLKGEEAAPVVEQRIGLSIADSSYVDNREVGQLLVIQGATTNNFGAVRSAITVKGVLLNADGKVLQQQTVFAGNYLSEEKLREIPYAQIEEAMNNQFGDSLTNMNVKPKATIRFTIVFRNPPQDLAGINVEVVDSKPGGL